MHNTALTAIPAILGAAVVITWTPLKRARVELPQEFTTTKTTTTVENIAMEVAIPVVLIKNMLLGMMGV